MLFSHSLHEFSMRHVLLLCRSLREMKSALLYNVCFDIQKLQFGIIHVNRAQINPHFGANEMPENNFLVRNK